MNKHIIDISHDWRMAIARYTAAQAARHAEHARRFIAAGWRGDTADFIAWEKVRDEDEVERLEQQGSK